MNIVYSCLRTLSFIALILSVNLVSKATSFTWGSTTTGGPWVTCSNWQGSSCPVSDATNSVTFNPSGSITINNIPPSFAFMLGTFTAGAGNGGTTTIGFSSAISFNVGLLNISTGNLTLGGQG